MQGVELRQGVEPQLAPLSTPVGELYRYQLVSDTLSQIELRTIQDWIVSRYLRLTPGVADVISRGGFIKQYQVNLDLPKMNAYNISIQPVFSAMPWRHAKGGGRYSEQ